MNSDKAIRQYCERYAEAEIHSLHDFPPHHFQHLIVIPAHREEGSFLLALQHLAERQGQVLAVLIVNGPDDNDSHYQDQALWDLASASGPPCWSKDNLKLVSWQNQSGLLLVDRFRSGRGIPPKHGVGLARKIGCDLALALQTQGKVVTNFIHNTDADATLPSDYLEQAAHIANVSALLYPFTHRAGPDPRTNQATALYERSLHYYVEGLRWAGSPYAFHTIGSCMAISLPHYAQARGFPKRAGGEDFYLLNKLAKLAPVAESRGQAICLQARQSDRVPFGTGPAVNKILALPSPDTFTSYAPDIFLELSQLLRSFSSLWHYRGNYSAWLAQHSDPIQEACSSLGIAILFKHLQTQANSEEHCLRFAHHWFDAFRTLKFVRHLQSHYYPAMSLADALSRAAELWKAQTPTEL